MSTIEKKERKKRKIIIYFCHYSLENIYIFFRRLIRVKNGIWKKTHIFRTLQVWWWSSYCDFHMSTCCFHMKITIIHHMHAPYAEFRFFLRFIFMMIMMMIMIIENLISILSFHSYIMTLVIVNYYQHQHKHQDLNVHLNQIICCVCQLKTHWDFRLLSSFSFIHSFNLMRTFFLSKTYNSNLLMN